MMMATAQQQVLLKEQQQPQAQQAQAQDEKIDFFNLMHDAAQSLYIVINDLMDYTKLEAGKMKLEYAPFEWRKVVNGCISVMKPRAHAKDLVIEFLDDSTWKKDNTNNNVDNVDDNDTNATRMIIPNMIVGDPNRIRQLLSNLLQNAIKFTRQGSITLSVTPIIVSEPDNIISARGKRKHEDDNEVEDEKVGGGEDANHGNDSDDSTSASTLMRPPPESRDPGDQKIVLKFVVADTGIGLSPAHAAKLFQKYQQADESIARTHGGTGLGLAICKSLVEAMGGSIGVESEIGLGSRFWFQVPFGIVHVDDHNNHNNDISIDFASSVNDIAAVSTIGLVPEKIANGLHVKATRSYRDCCGQWIKGGGFDWTYHTDDHKSWTYKQQQFISSATRTPTPRTMQL
jgi:signal transduction histidine kinase